MSFSQLQGLNTSLRGLITQQPQVAGGKKKKSTKSKSTKTKKQPKLIDKYNKTQLERMAKKHGVSLKSRLGKPKTKLQLFNSLKRKNLIH
jgi:hypothetical protein